jgi:tRNA threonylcarbamoyladenosine biosynthesis protein TsaE
LLRGLGYSGVVKSPTYTLLEPYNIDGQEIYHFDLYRVNDPQELEFVGFDEIVDGPGLKLFEWPEKASSWLRQADVQVTLSVVDTTEPASREVTVEFT